MSDSLILHSNDDGVTARGLLTLRAALKADHRVVTVAPTTQQSAGSHALTLHRPLRHRTVEPDLHGVDGSPADCIYVGVHHDLLLPRMPDLAVSGINHGYNLGSDICYSGTVAAAREAALRGVPAIAFSVGPKGDFEAAAEVARRLVARVLSHADGCAGLFLNVNFPPGSDYRGVRVTRLGRRIYADEVDVRHDPRGREYFWIGGRSAHHEPLEGSDTEAVDDGWVSVTPLSLDSTDGQQVGLAAWVAAIDQETQETES